VRRSIGKCGGAAPTRFRDRYSCRSRNVFGTVDRMNDPNSSSTPPPARATLKLKAGARKPPVESKTPAAPPPSKPVNPNARWSDEYKQRMQADMDALVARRR